MRIDEVDNGDTQKLIRNRIQDRILAASIQRCDEFKRALQKYEADVNFLFGSFTTVLAGAGSIFTRANTARVLSGLAGISSGTRAEFNSDFFKDLSIEVVTKGITARRKNKMLEIKEKRDGGLMEYTTLAAIGDALEFHGGCTVIAGLEEASDSITKVTDPGLAALARSAEAMINLRAKFVEAFNVETAANGGDDDQEDVNPNRNGNNQQGNEQGDGDIQRDPAPEEN